MSARAWLATCLLTLVIGGIIGWAARVGTADHRYIRALAERHESEAAYYNGRTDSWMRGNYGDITKERSPKSGTKN